MKTSIFSTIFAIFLSCFFFCTSALDVYVTSQNFLFYRTYVDIPDYRGRMLASSAMRDLAVRYFQEMQDEWPAKQLNVGRHNQPRMMTALWIPETGRLILASSVVGGPRGGGRFGYHPSNVPRIVTRLLEEAAASGWPTDDHRTGGSCGEIACLAEYFDIYRDADGSGLQDAKFITVGVPPSDGDQNRAWPTVQNPCTGGESERGCRDFLAWMRIRWCGPSAGGRDRISKRLEGRANEDDKDTKDTKDDKKAPKDEPLYCHVPEHPSGKKDEPPKTGSVEISSFLDTATSNYKTNIAIPTAQKIHSISGGAAVAGKTTIFSVSGPIQIGDPTGTAKAQKATGSAEADDPTGTAKADKATGTAEAEEPTGTADGDAAKGKEACVKECTSGFKTCKVSEAKKVRRHGVQALEARAGSVDCSAFAKCHLTDAPVKKTKSGKKTKTEIDKTKATAACNTACTSIAGGKAKDKSGKAYDMDDLTTCLKAL